MRKYIPVTIFTFLAIFIPILGLVFSKILNIDSKEGVVIILSCIIAEIINTFWLVHHCNKLLGNKSSINRNTYYDDRY